MKKTMKRIMCVLMSVLMAFGCTSAAFAAYNGITYTARGVSENMSDNDCITVVVDMLDSALKSANISLDVGQTLKENLTESQLITLRAANATASVFGFDTLGKVLSLVVDLRSIDGLLKAVDDFKSILYYSSGSENALWATLKLLLGDLKDLNLKNWTSGLSRKVSGDKKVLNSLISLIKDNASLVGKLAANTFNTGILSYESKDFLGEDGIKGIAKEALVKMVYSDTSSAEYKAAVTKTLDQILYDVVIPNLLAGEDDYLSGLTLSATTSIDSLIDNIWNICWNKYMAPALKKINITYDSGNALAMSFAKVIKLDFYNEQSGSSSFDTNFTVDTSKSFLKQANGLLGFLAKQFIQPAYKDGFTWKTDADGGYKLIGENIKNLFVYILKCADFSGTKYSEQAERVLSSTNPDFNSVILLTMKVIMAEFAGEFNTAEVQACNDIYEMAFLLLKEIVTNELGIKAVYTSDDDYLDVCADILAYYLDMIVPLKDYNGNSYKAGGGAELNDVVNYLANYYQYTRGFQKAFHLPEYSLRSDPYKKADALIGLIFSDATSAADRFDTELMILGKNGSKGLFDSILTFDFQNILDITVTKFLNYINSISGMTATKMIYSFIKNVLDNMFNKKIITNYATSAPFDNMLSSENLSATVTNLISSIDDNKNNLIPCVCYLVSLFVPIDKDWSVLIADGQYDGVAVTPKVTVKFNGKLLTQDKDYTVTYSDNNAIGTGKAIVKGKGNYEGEYETTFRILGADIAKAQVKLSATSFNYTGRANVPSVTVSYNNKTLIKGTDYNLSYKDNIAPGAGYAVISGIGKYSGTYNAAFYIKPSQSVTGITQIASSSSGATLTWDDVTGATGYRVFYGSPVRYVTVSSTKAVVTGLGSNLAYKAYVRPFTKASDGTVVWGYNSAAYVFRAGPAKTNVTVSGNTTSSVKVSWSAVTGAYRYQLFKYDYSTKTWTRCAVTGATSFVAKSLKVNSAYAFRVRAYSYVNGIIYYGDYSANRVTRTLPAACTGLKAAGSGSNWVKLTWNAVPGARYNVYTYNASSKRWVAAANATSNSAVIKNLASQRTYQFKVRAVVVSGGVSYIGAFSGPVSATTVFAKVSGIALTSRTADSLGLKWTAVSGASSYQIYKYDAASKSFKYLAASRTNTCLVRNLTGGTAYSFEVRALKVVNGKSVYGEFSSPSIVITAPVQVTGIKASSTSNSMTLTWTAVNGATSYDIFVQNASGNYVKADTVKSASCKVTGLSRNTTYKFKVRAVMNIGSSAIYGAESKVFEGKTNLWF